MVVKKPADIAGLRRANRETATLLRELALLVRPGVTTGELDTHAAAFLARLGAEPIFHTETGFPGCINTSVNDVVLHGVPGDQALRAGDIISIDAGMRLDGYCGDANVTVPVGAIGARRRRLIAAARGAMTAGIAAAVTGKRVGDISHAMQRYGERRGFNLVRGFHGHGLGHRMHEEPPVPFVGRPGTGPLLQEGLVITIEPILVEGSPRVATDADGWSVRTVDGGWAAQFEQTIVVTRAGGMILSEG
ncbi:MAG: Methionine aminopeptidase [uncultured Thermomicrobiales bacterium]|uniref:Methionine aminopeptidase n=1 Tax=uncultured Thermomicrobiales bacterium TaxID=1645740 RepID=A0A6J4V5Y1_9BACT|nr:MAG: Methionine aminopeptidase [uncultured Thermomicrobiales bacterium]